jgi:pyruvate-formate lyase-activating enzyme
MMRFSLRLTLDLTRVVIAQKLFGVARRPLALSLDLSKFSAQAAGVPAHRDDTSLTDSSRDLQALGAVRASIAPIVWIGGDTPLHYPRIGHLTREIIDLGRTVFVEMDGRLLRRRIHEFRPVSRLYLVLPLLGLRDAHDLRAAHPGSFRATMESIRTAKLSGFHVCVETPVSADTEAEELRGLANFITTLDVDGWIQTHPADSEAGQPSEETLAAARELIPNRGWKTFSKHLSQGAPQAESARGEVGNVAAIPETKLAGPSNPNLTNHEESVRAL